MPEEFVIVHTEWGRRWSGGTKQVALLLEGLAQRGVKSYLVCQEGSMIAERMQGKVPLKTFNLRGEHDLRTWLDFARWLKVFWERQSSLNHTLLVHVHSRRGAFPTLLVTRLLKLPTVLHWRVAAPLNMPVKRLANAVIVISEAARNYAVRAGMAQEKVFLVRSAIHVEDFRRPGEEVPRDLRRQLGILEEAFVIAETARMAPGKGHDVILKAIVELPPSERPIVLMAGNGHEGEKLQRLAENLGLNQFVRFTGFIDDVRTVLWASNVFVHVPNFFPEGVSVAILEAMAAGLPVIASKVGGIPEVVKNGETGLIVPPNDPKALAEAINELRKDKALCEKIGKQAQEWVRKHHDARQLPDRVIQVYSQVTAKKIVGS